MGDDRLPKLLMNWQPGGRRGCPERSGQITWGEDWKDIVWDRGGDWTVSVWHQKWHFANKMWL